MSNYEKYKRNAVFFCLAGSRAYGLDRPDSDWDLRGVYIAPTEEWLGINEPPDELEEKRPPKETKFYEIGKFVKLALNANPNILELLWTPDFTVMKIFEPFHKNRKAFLSKKIAATYRGYAQSQFIKLGQDIKQREDIRWKHAAHLLRLMTSGALALDIGEVPVKVGGRSRDFLKSVLAGDIPFDDVMKRYHKQEENFDLSLARSKLPDEPDYDLINKLLVTARCQALEASPINDWAWL